MSEIDRNVFNYPFRSMTDFSDEFYRPTTGRELQVEPLGLGPTADVVVAGGYVFALTSDSLVVLNAQTLDLVGRLGGLVSARQIAVNGNIAVVTARESGVFVVDISDPSNPRLASLYDPVEFATGVHLASPKLAILTCRHYGLEFVDVSNPSAPRFLSSLLVGEAQSVMSIGTIAYAGVWFEKELVLVDFIDPTKPSIIGRSPLDGFGDGVHVHNDLAYVATGHHSGLQRDPRTFELAKHITLDMLESGYGKGHGIEIHDVSDPKNPRCLERIKSAPGFGSPDTWRVIRHEGLLIQSDSGTGVFVYDLSSPTHPTPLAFGVLPAFELHRKRRTQSMQEDRHPVTGVAVAGNMLLLAGSTSDLYRCALPSSFSGANEGFEARSPFLSQYPQPDVPQRADGDNLLETEGQIHWLASDDEAMFVAAGADGLYMLDPTTKRVLAHQRTHGLSQHVFCSRGLIYVSEVTGGLTIWERNGTSLRSVGLWQPGPSVRQVLIPEAMPFGIAITGPGEFAVLDLSDPTAPQTAGTHQLVGHAYARVLADQMVDAKYALGATQGSGLSWFDLSDASRAADTPMSSEARLCPIAEGIAVHAGQALVVQAGGYYIASPDRVQSHGDAEHIREPNRFFSGTPQSVGQGRLVVTNRATGSARILDLSDASAPRTLAYLHLPGNPDRPIRVGDHLVFPCGRGGLRAVPCP